MLVRIQVPDAMAYIEQMDAGPDLLVTLNNCIVQNKSIGLYDGCKTAVALAHELANAPAASSKKASSSSSKSPKRAAKSPARR